MSILIQNVHVKLGKTTLLDAINFTVKKGQIWGIIGENGAGKSTLLNCLSGSQSYSGCIQYNGKLMEDYTARELAQTRAVLPQKSMLSFPLSVFDVVTLSMQLSDQPTNKIRDFAYESLQWVNATQFLDRDYQSLSGGEKQRIQLARVIAQLLCSSSKLTKYLLLDEPTSALDLCHQIEIFKLLEKLKENEFSIIIIVHDLNMASLFCDQLVLLKNGSMLAHGSPDDVLTQTNIQKTFNIETMIQPHIDIKRPYIIPRL